MPWLQLDDQFRCVCTSMCRPPYAALATPPSRRGRVCVLTQIKRVRPSALHSRVMATPDNRPQLKTCPSCGITMVMTKWPAMSKSRPITLTGPWWPPCAVTLFMTSSVSPSDR
jgi:hypothetical protein